MAWSVGVWVRECTCFWQVKGGKGWTPYALCAMLGAGSRFEGIGVGMEIKWSSIADDVDLGNPS